MGMNARKLKNLAQYRGRSEEEVAHVAASLGERRVTVVLPDGIAKAERCEIITVAGTIVAAQNPHATAAGLWYTDDEGTLFFRPWAHLAGLRFVRGVLKVRR